MGGGHRRARSRTWRLATGGVLAVAVVSGTVAVAESATLSPSLSGPAPVTTPAPPVPAPGTGPISTSAAWWLDPSGYAASGWPAPAPGY